jgi:hypothetical protein
MVVVVAVLVQTEVQALKVVTVVQEELDWHHPLQGVQSLVQAVAVVLLVMEQKLAVLVVQAEVVQAQHLGQMARTAQQILVVVVAVVTVMRRAVVVL